MSNIQTEAKMGKVMRHTLGASLNIRHNLSSSKGPKPLQLKLLTTYIPKTSAFTLAFSTSQRLRTTRASARTIDIQITLKQMLRDFIGIRVNRAKKSGMVNITSSVNSRERSGINTILHELNPLFTINVTMRDIKSKNVYSRVNSKA